MSISQPPSSISRAPSLLSVEVPLDVIDEIEERKDRERIEWRRSCRLASDRALAREAEAREAEAGEGKDNYPVVKATIGAVGDGQPSGQSWRDRKEVCLTII